VVLIAMHIDERFFQAQQARVPQCSAYRKGAQAPLVARSREDGSS
jgi:hypothetical protein